jgi:hypothetical protein
MPLRRLIRSEVHCRELTLLVQLSRKPAPSKIDADELVAVEPTPGPSVMRYRTDEGGNRSIINQMRSRVARYDASSTTPSKAKGKERETDQSVLAL